MKTTDRNRLLSWCACVGLFLVSAPLWSRTSFDGLDLGADDRLLFRAETGGDGSARQSALFWANVATGALTQLTVYPEHLEVVESGRSLQIRNPFGAVRVSLSGGLPRPVPGFPSFATGALVLSGRSEALAASPDGKWLLYVEPTSAAFGKLVLIDAATGSRVLVSEGVERPGRFFPASWSPDSRVFVYERDRKLYSRSVDTSSSAVVDERYRLVGDGSIASIRWGTAGDFFYIRGSTIYRVRGSDLFARSLYADFLEIGRVAGKIPFEFNPNFDSFWTAPDGSAVLLAVGGRNVFYYPLGVDDYGDGGTASLPYLMLPRSCSAIRVLWSQSGIVTVFASFPAGSATPSRVYRLKYPENQAALASWGFTEIQAPSNSSAVLSPDGTRALLFGPSGAEVFDYVNWRSLLKASARPTPSAAWLGNEEFIVADASRIERRSMVGKSSLLCLSSADAHGYDETGKLVVAKNADGWFQTDGKTGWKPSAYTAVRNAATSDAKYRVYIETLPSGPYAALPMVREIRGVGTRSLLVPPSAESDPAMDFIARTAAEKSVNADGIFNAGNRQGRREIALTFDLMEDAEGLPFVLDTLKRFGIRATFFMNGEFIGRHPAAAKEIAAAGHECGSLFFAPIDLTDGRYRIDADFIKRGLARNEDAFFNASSSELSLLWHAPYYAYSSAVVSAAEAVGYRYVGRDIDPMDWYTRTDARRNAQLYRGASAIVDYIVAQKRPGSVVPVRLGIPSGGRDDYLFGRMDVLLDAIVRAGYEVVPVSVLMDHAR